MSSDISAAGKIPAPPPPAPIASPPPAAAARPAAAAAASGNARTAGPRSADPVIPAHRQTRGLAWAAGTGIGTAIVLMVAVSLVRGGWMRPPLVIPTGGPPWQLPVRHVSADVVSYVLWFAALASAGGVAAGLLAIRRGARLNARLLLIIGLITEVLDDTTG